MRDKVVAVPKPSRETGIRAPARLAYSADQSSAAAALPLRRVEATASAAKTGQAGGTGASERRPGRLALADDVPRRLAELRAEIDERRLDAMLVTSTLNVHYLTGFAGDDSALLVGPRALVLVSDFRYEQEAAESAPLAEFVQRRGPLLAACVDQARRRGWTRLAFELTGMLAADRDDLAKCARSGRTRTGKRRPMKLAGLRDLVEALRMLKSPAEVEAIRRAVRTAEKAGSAVRDQFRRATSPGPTELEFARRAARRMEDLGASGPSFPTIAALGARSALPHARPGKARAGRGSSLLLDWGARVDFYCSDLTRVWALNTIPSWLRRVHAAVLEAQRAAIGRVGPGVPAAEVDAAGRDVLRRAGWGRRFGHGIGHGVGLEVHEAPRLGPGSKDVLRPGMVVTIEPGVYLPGKGGVRIEDDVVVTDGGAEVLSRLSRAIW